MPASPPRIYRTGSSGIWVIDTSNTVSHAYGLLSEDKKVDVQRILKDLSERKWSKSLNGLRIWASVVPYEHYKNPVIIFAVQNVSDSNMYIPTEFQNGFLNAIAINDKGEKFSYNLSTKKENVETVFCRSIPVKQITYLHPDYSYIDLVKHNNLPPGKYSVTIECSNTRDGIIVGETRLSRVQVPVWKGKLQAEPVELVIKEN